MRSRSDDEAATKNDHAPVTFVVTELLLPIICPQKLLSIVQLVFYLQLPPLLSVPLCLCGTGADLPEQTDPLDHPVSAWRRD